MWKSITRCKVIVLLLAILLIGSVLVDTEVEVALVSRVIDGDTVQLSDGRIVRYLGIDTPEYGEPLYWEATRANKRLVLGKMVELHSKEQDKDIYGRLLRYVKVEGISVAKILGQYCTRRLR